MSITTLDGLIAAPKQRVQYFKSASRTSVAAFPFSMFDLAGQPGAGVLAGANTANGVKPDDSVAGFPIINAFGGAARGYISKVEFANTVAGWLDLYDCLFKAGAYAFNASVALTSQPAYSSRIPSGTDYTGLQIWVEQVTAATLNQAVNVTYTNQAGTTGKTTGATGIGAAPTVGRMWQLPLAAGDSGVQKIENVVGSVASAGTFNVLVLRPLWSGRVNLVNAGDVHDMLKTGLVEVWTDSALFPVFSADSTSTGIPELMIEIANG